MRQGRARSRQASVLSGALTVGLLVIPRAAPATAPDAGRLADAGAEPQPAEPAVDGLLSVGCDVLLGNLQAALLDQVYARAALVRSSPALYGGGGPASGYAPSFSPITNTQLPDGKDGDFFQIDGDRLLMVDIGFGGSLDIIDATGGVASAVVASLPIEGAPRDLVVQGGKALVFGLRHLLRRRPRLPLQLPLAHGGRAGRGRSVGPERA
jgi:hypothetical protein